MELVAAGCSARLGRVGGIRGAKELWEADDTPPELDLVLLTAAVEALVSELALLYVSLDPDDRLDRRRRRILVG